MRVKRKNSIVPIYSQWHRCCKLTSPHANNIDAHQLFPSTSSADKVVFCFSCLSPSSPVEVRRHFEWHLYQQKTQIERKSAGVDVRKLWGYGSLFKGVDLFQWTSSRGCKASKMHSALAFYPQKDKKNHSIHFETQVLTQFLTHWWDKLHKVAFPIFA